MGSTKIEWADAAWNPITGCTPISEGCGNCYARRMANRLMHPDWVRSLRDQCVAAGVPFFFKGWGEWAPFTGEFFEAPRYFGVHSWQSDEVGLRVGKKAAGRKKSTPTIPMRGTHIRMRLASSSTFCANILDGGDNESNFYLAAMVLGHCSRP